MGSEKNNRREKMLKLREENRLHGDKGYSVDEICNMMKQTLHCNMLKQAAKDLTGNVCSH